MINVTGNKITLEMTRASLQDKSAFETAVNTLADSGNASEILLDFSRTVYLPSEFLGFLLGKKRALKSRGIDIRIVAISEPLRRIFEEAKIGDFVDV
jgi:anti-anti-sigma regulatory factor